MIRPVIFFPAGLERRRVGARPAFAHVPKKLLVSSHEFAVVQLRSPSRDHHGLSDVTKSFHRLFPVRKRHCVNSALANNSGNFEVLAPGPNNYGLESSECDTTPSVLRTKRFA